MNNENVINKIEVNGIIYDITDNGITVFEIQNGHLIAINETGIGLTNYSLENGHLYLTIGE